MAGRNTNAIAGNGARLAVYNESSRTIHLVSTQLDTHPVTGQERLQSVCKSFTGSGGSYTTSSQRRLLTAQQANSLPSVPSDAVVIDQAVLDGGGYIQHDGEVLGKLCGNCCQQLDSLTDEV